MKWLVGTEYGYGFRLQNYLVKIIVAFPHTVNDILCISTNCRSNTLDYDCIRLFSSPSCFLQGGPKGEDWQRGWGSAGISFPYKRMGNLDGMTPLRRSAGPFSARFTSLAPLVYLFRGSQSVITKVCQLLQMHLKDSSKDAVKIRPIFVIS